MQRSDEIDAKLAKYFAWSFVRPGEAAQLGDRLRSIERACRQPPSEPAGDGAALGQTEQLDGRIVANAREKATEVSEQLSASIADAWAIPDGEASRRAVRRLLRRADRLGFDLLGLQDWPVEAVRLVRMLVRCSPGMTPRQREQALRVAGFVP